MRLIHKFSIFLLALVLIPGAIFFAAKHNNNFHDLIGHYFPINTVRVYGVQHVNHDNLRRELAPLIQHGFFVVDVDAIRDHLLQLPWIEDSIVRRAWPDRIDITVVERLPVARWGEDSLLSASGEIFYPDRTTYPANLPRFVGPDGQHIVMMQYYSEMNRLFLPIHARITYLELSPYLAWTLTLDNGIRIRIGHKDVLTRLTHFVKVYRKIIGNNEAGVEYVDLRYSNGVAVRWKTKE